LCRGKGSEKKAEAMKDALRLPTLQAKAKSEEEAEKVGKAEKEYKF
jgi:hypothetical protein